MVRVERMRAFLREGIWKDPGPAAPKWSRPLLTLGRVTYISGAGFNEDLCMTRSSALAFATLIALVPVLALLFAVLRGLGWHGERLETLILSKATLLSPEAIDTIVSYVDNVNFAGLGAIGGVFLLVSFASLVGSIETAFNAIWDDVPARTWTKRLSHYFGIIVIAPMLLVVALSSTAVVRGHPLYLWLLSQWGVGFALQWSFGYVAWVGSWLLFAFLYVFVPNTRVRLLPAVIGGVVAGSVWQLTQWAYIEFQIGMSNYDTIYGALAQLPLLMVWVFLSWLIVLGGAEIAHALQTVHVYSRERRAALKSGQIFREWIGLAVAVELARAALRKTEPASADALAYLFDVPARTVRDALTAFARDGIAHETAAGSGCCYLSVAPQCIPVTRVITALRGTVPTEEAHPTSAESARTARDVLLRMEEETTNALGRHTLRDVALAWPLTSERVADRHAGVTVTARGSAASDTERRDRQKGGV
jgi:membrane protein